MADVTQFIKKVLLAFEQSRTSIKYDSIYIYKDGPDNREQITLSFGITEYGNLKKFLQEYCNKDGKHTKDFLEYIPNIGVKPLVTNSSFITLLKESAKDPVMQQCQEHAYDSMYITPALKWCEKNQLILPLSKLVIADSFLHSGSILSKIRNSFSAKIPANGGDEKVWVEQYCNARRQWLATHSRTDLRKTVYRMNFMISVIKKNDWELTQPFYVANGVKIVAN
jgi:chitosanase